MGNLKQNSDSVSGLSFCVFPRPVFKIFHNLKRLADYPVCLFSLYIYDCADSAVIVLQHRAVQSLFSFHLILPFASFLFLMLCRRFDKARKQRMRTIRPGFEFRMSLSSDIKRMICDLNHFHNPFVR